MKTYIHYFLFIVILLSLFCSCSLSRIEARSFSSPELALSELSDAVNSRSAEKTNAIFGPNGNYLLNSGDSVLDTAQAHSFLEFFKEKHTLQEQPDGSFVLLVGKKNWLFPVPLIKRNDAWYFDAESGRDVILARRIAADEKYTIIKAGEPQPYRGYFFKI